MGSQVHLSEIPPKFFAAISFEFDLLVLKIHIKSSNRFGLKKLVFRELQKD